MPLVTARCYRPLQRKVSDVSLLCAPVGDTGTFSQIVRRVAPLARCCLLVCLCRALADHDKTSIAAQMRRHPCFWFRRPACVRGARTRRDQGHSSPDCTQCGSSSRARVSSFSLIAPSFLAGDERKIRCDRDARAGAPPSPAFQKIFAPALHTGQGSDSFRCLSNLSRCLRGSGRSRI